jgi:uncharacterized protein
MPFVPRCMPVRPYWEVRRDAKKELLGKGHRDDARRARGALLMHRSIGSSLAVAMVIATCFFYVWAPAEIVDNQTSKYYESGRVTLPVPVGASTVALPEDPPRRVFSLTCTPLRDTASPSSVFDCVLTAPRNSDFTLLGTVADAFGGAVPSKIENLDSGPVIGPSGKIASVVVGLVQIAFALVLFAVAPALADRATSRHKRVLVISAVTGSVAAVLVQPALVALVLDRDVLGPACNLSGSGASVIISALLVAPIGEELLYRGWALPLLARQLGIVPATLVTSGLFSLYHAALVPETASAMQLGTAFVISLFLSLLRFSSGSVWPCVLTHLLVNTIAVFFMLC